MVLGFTLLLLFPMGLALYMSLTDWPLLGDHHFIGMDNYRNIMTDAMFWKVLANTVYFTVGLVPLNIVLALLLALLLSRNLRGIGIFRTAIFVPVMTSLIVWAIVWKLMYATESGLINQLLLMAGIKGPAWLYNEDLAMPAVIVTSVLKNVGLNMVLFIAAIQQVPRSLYEAATLDGAGKGNLLSRHAAHDHANSVFDSGHDRDWFTQSIWADLCDDPRRAEQQHKGIGLLYLGKSIQIISVWLCFCSRICAVLYRANSDAAAMAAPKEVGIQ